MRGLACLALAAGLVGAAQSPTERFDQAITALSAGNYAAAESGFLNVLRVAPNHLATLQNLGVVYARTGRADQAIAIYRRALELSPHDRSVQLNLGLTYMRINSYDDAMAVFQTMAQEDPTSRPVRDIHLLYPLCDGFLKQSPTEERRRELAGFLAHLTPAAASLVRCKILYAGERLDEAGNQCRRVLEIDPQFPGARVALARVLVAQQSPETAKELTAALRENPDDPEDLYDLGLALAVDGRTAEAAHCLERATALNPGFWGAYFELGKLRLRLGQAAAAVPLLQHAAELNPTSFSLFYELARALNATGKTKDAAQAMDRVRELMASDLAQDTKAMRKK
jgi:tetratricopeptide (TPR) repeat protein